MSDVITLHVGEDNEFSILSCISKAYYEPSKFALGFFQICIANNFFGVRSADATLLACSFDEVNKRIESRGKHTPSFSSTVSAEEIALSFIKAIYSEETDKFFLGLERSKFVDDLYDNFLIWAPDGDQAFDDGSIVLHFDIGNMVRLIGFRRSNDDPLVFEALKDLYIGEDVFYEILKDWSSKIRIQRKAHLDAA